MTPEPFDTLCDVGLPHANADGGFTLGGQNSDKWQDALGGNDRLEDEGSLGEFQSEYHGGLTLIPDRSEGLSMALGRGALAASRKRRRGIGNLGGSNALKQAVATSPIPNEPEAR